MKAALIVSTKSAGISDLNFRFSIFDFRLSNGLPSLFLPASHGRAEALPSKSAGISRRSSFVLTNA
jgi:hypothetical protein